VVPKVAMGQGLWCLKRHCDTVRCVQIGTGAGFEVPKSALGQGLVYLNCQRGMVFGT